MTNTYTVVVTLTVEAATIAQALAVTQAAIINESHSRTQQRLPERLYIEDAKLSCDKRR